MEKNLDVCVGRKEGTLYIVSLGRIPNLGSGFQLLSKKHISPWDQAKNLNLIVKLIASPQDNDFSEETSFLILSPSLH